MSHFVRSRIFYSILGLFLSGCTAAPYENSYDDIATRREVRDRPVGKLFGDEAVTLGDAHVAQNETTGIGVNSYLWRATLDTLSFMPLQLVDPFGGVILTQWHTAGKTPDERLKVDVRILDCALRSDGLKISVFRQKMVSGRWVAQTVSASTVRDLENAILTRARQLKIQSGR